MSLTLTNYLHQVNAGQLDPKQVVSQQLQIIREKNADLFPFLRLHEKFTEEHLDTLVQ
jgi:hypothetical protein